MILTISRQMGSQGKAVATEASLRLGYRLVWREVINQAALRAGVPEVALATIDEVGFLGIRPRQAELQAYHRAVRQVMMELAREDNVVIVGRAGQIILQDQPGVVHVRIIAPREARVARVASDKNLSIQQAAGLVDRSDQTRRQYLRRYYHVNVDDPILYNLVINMEHLEVGAAAEVVCTLVRSQRSGNL